jgi:hypothetical protein
MLNCRQVACFTGCSGQVCTDRQGNVSRAGWTPVTPVTTVDGGEVCASTQAKQGPGTADTLVLHKVTHSDSDQTLTPILSYRRTLSTPHVPINTSQQHKPHHQHRSVVLPGCAGVPWNCRATYHPTPAPRQPVRPNRATHTDTPHQQHRSVVLPGCAGVPWNCRATYHPTLAPRQPVRPNRATHTDTPHQQHRSIQDSCNCLLLEGGSCQPPCHCRALPRPAAW